MWKDSGANVFRNEVHAEATMSLYVTGGRRQQRGGEDTEEV